MKGLSELLLELLENKEAKKFLAGLRNLEPNELKKINDKIYFQGENLSPLSIIIRRADSIKSASKIVQELITLGADVNVDYGYHGDRHPECPLPPLVEAIKFSLERENASTLYTKIGIVLIKNGASINKINNNISPLFACYNITGELVENEENNPEAIQEFKQRKRNKLIFDLILNDDSLNVETFDIIKDIWVPWRNRKQAFAGQLLDFIDRELKRYQVDKVRRDFFIPII